MKNQIKAIILDVDGVIVGEKIGFNSPQPHPQVTQALKETRAHGIFISLCTAKPHYSVKHIIQEAHLNNPHITDAGAVVIDPIDKIIINTHFINITLAAQVVDKCLSNGIYVEFYDLDAYYIQKDRQTDITTIHNHILQQSPEMVLSLSESAKSHRITKIMPIATDAADKERVNQILSQFSDKLSISWGVHPVALPHQFAIITNQETSKKAAAIEIIRTLNLQFSEVLGVGDSTSDWQFMELCGYAATVENGTDEIKELVKSKGEGKYYIGKSVDENGFLDIVKFYFS